MRVRAYRCCVVLLVVGLVFGGAFWIRRARAATFVVVSTSNALDANPGDGVCASPPVSGSLCTLRAAIMEANALAGTDVITFNLGTGTPLIPVVAPLPTITGPVIIDGNTGGATRVQLDGATAGDAFGLTLGAGSGGSQIRSLVISNFSSVGLVIQSSGNTIQNNLIGTDSSGTTDQGNGSHGIWVFGVANNLIGGTSAGTGNVISGNNSGILLDESSGNMVQGNLIGTNAAGTAALGNNLAGITILRAANNVIGGTTAGARNVISGNSNIGVGISGLSSTGNVVQGNFIGTDATGTADLGNTTDGVVLTSAPDNTVGGTASGAGNLISGNNNNGVRISDTSGNVVQGNFIGTDITGTADLGNSLDGVALTTRATNNTVGGTAAGARNVISGNNSNGVRISDTSGNLVEGNLIGTNAAGAASLGNNSAGVLLSNATNNIIGGTTPAARNVISGNSNLSTGVNGGVVIVGGMSSGNRVEGNFIGTDATGAVSLENRLHGVEIDEAPNNVIGGTATGAGNIISGNNSAGIIIREASGNRVEGNFIGTDATGSVALQNGASGIQILRAPNNIIGGTTAAARNIISGNSAFGLTIGGLSGSGNLVQNNFIGLSVTGAPLGNCCQGGIAIVGSPNNRIGGGAGLGNNIAFNGGPGVVVFNVGAEVASGNAILSNSVFSNDDLGIDLNNDGVTANDALDPDAGPNNLQNFPVITAAMSNPSANTTAVQGTLNSTANAAFTIEFFTSAAADPAGHGEGQTFRGSTGVTTDASGNASFSVDVPAATPAGHFMTATATDPANNTSEFSPAVMVLTPDPTPTPTPTPMPTPAVSVSDASVAEGHTGTTTIFFNITLSAPSAEEVLVTVATADATATSSGPAPLDYVPLSLAPVRLAFAPGQTQASIGLTVYGDTEVEPDETFTLLLSDPVGATLADTQSTGTILNDDPAPARSTPPADAAITFEFAAAAFSAGETDGHALVTVTRAGDASAEQSVAFESADGTASERSDYTTAAGRLRFAPGESSQTFRVLLTADGFAEGAETVNLALSDPSGGAALGQTSRATLTIRDGDGEASAPASAHPADASSFYVRQHYLDFLGREPDAAGLRFWTDQIETCGADAACREVRRVNVSAAFFLSIEFQETGFFAHRLHRAAFGGLPRYRDWLRDAREAGEGVVVGRRGWEQTLEANRARLVEAAVGRPAFRALYDGRPNAEYVEVLFRNAGVRPAPSELAALAAGLDAGAETRATVLRQVIEHEQFTRLETTRAFVLAQYLGYLRRNPDDLPDTDLGGFNFWLGKLNRFGGDYRRAEMVRAFLDSIEYRRRFDQPSGLGRAD